MLRATQVEPGEVRKALGFLVKERREPTVLAGSGILTQLVPDPSPA